MRRAATVTEGGLLRRNAGQGRAVMPLVYVASKAKHSHWWRALRAAGVPISATWVDAELNEAGADEPTADAWRDHWDKCVAEAAEAELCLFVCNEGETACGALIAEVAGIRQ